MLWTYFEAQVCGTKAGAPLLLNIAKDVATAEYFDPAALKKAMAHFRNRYLENGQPSYHFDHLNFREEKYAKKVLAILSSDGSDPVQELQAALLIVFRYRNNLFHGIKWAYQLSGQKTNFSRAIDLLKSVIPVAVRVRGRIE
ncbi:hypothetical protein C798_25255 [Herbaspirillum rubrisubalbicans Os34]|uniref:Apea-like HEPN domain-containing protein n=2 Tax=Herbaspirillum rubrisubalbicans TaxID=80842 RepID=A0A6M4A159_9BURK|nr:hypothetical protein C798_25255 [Herbaspirillum rubrisubalbicans Os34]